MADWRRAFRAFRQLGGGQLAGYALYQLGVHSGFYAWATGAPLIQRSQQRVGRLRSDLLALPEGEQLAAVLDGPGQQRLFAEAEEILAGQVRLFGGAPVPLQLRSPEPLQHWSEIERQNLKAHLLAAPQGDVKFLWEPARFGWALVLARRYRLQPEGRLVVGFWQQLQTFLEANPPYLGVHWVSGQEVALRLIALVFAWQVFASAPETTPERAQSLARAVAWHAARLPPTLIYARAQNNNHLLSEAAALFTAGVALPEHPQASHWRHLGWRWFKAGIERQVATDGSYVQHSLNYHRLMLQLGLWVQLLAQAEGASLPLGVQQRLAAATRWLAEMVDARSGRAPNLGPNDGALILPLSSCDFGDYRPVALAAGRAFGVPVVLPPGPWDEMALWLSAGRPASRTAPVALTAGQKLTLAGQPAPTVLHSPDGRSWAYLRAVRFRSRPGHSDQLHLDLWWEGQNLALDAGTYLYNAPPPWDNALRWASIHNTVTVDEADPMSNAGRFLFLDWAQAEVLERVRAEDNAWERLVAQQYGYRRKGLVHRRSVTAWQDGRWLVEDALLPSSRRSARSAAHTACLHWLLPDWPFELQLLADGALLALQLPQGVCRLQLSAACASACQLARAGERIAGSQAVSPVWGWFSPTYGVKIPALSLRLWVTGALPLTMHSSWSLTGDALKELSR